MRVIVLLATSILTINSSDGSHSIFRCQYINALFVDQGGESCAPYDCWNSQLLDLSRDSLINIFNDYHALIAQKKCNRCAFPGVGDFGPVFQVNYHWLLEYVALHYQSLHNKTCEFQHRVPITAEDLMNYGHNLNNVRGNFQEFGYKDIEYSSTSFKINPNEDQTSAIEKFKRLMYDDQKHNLFNAWNETNYRYTLAIAFGCTLRTRSNVTGVTAVREIVHNGRVVFLACVFALKSPADDISRWTTVARGCNHYRALYDSRTKLCYYPQFQKYTYDDIPCQFFYKTSSGTSFPTCESPPPRVWLKNETPDPRHTKISIRVSNSSVIELEIGTGLTVVKEVTTEISSKFTLREEVNLKKSVVIPLMTTAPEHFLENKNREFTINDLKIDVDHSDSLIEYELIDYDIEIQKEVEEDPTITTTSSGDERSSLKFKELFQFMTHRSTLEPSEHAATTNPTSSISVQVGDPLYVGSVGPHLEVMDNKWSKFKENLAPNVLPMFNFKPLNSTRTTSSKMFLVTSSNCSSSQYLRSIYVIGMIFVLIRGLFE